MFHALHRLDVSILRSLYAANASPTVLTVLLAVTFLGSGWMIPLMFAPLAVKRLRARLAAIVVSLVGMLLVVATFVATIKVLIGRVRPCYAIAWARQLPIDAPGDASFPSGHAAGSFAFAFFLLALHRPTGLLAILFAIPIAVSRVVIGVHYPTDVICGAGLGAVLGFLGGRYAIGLVRAAGARHVRRRSVG
jgi:undecaprenyl-diphosphatase